MVALVLPPRELALVPPPVGVVGHKGRGLCRLQALKARVPRFGVVTAQAFDAFVEQPGLRDALRDATGADLDDEATLQAVGDRLVQRALQTPLPTGLVDGLQELDRAFADDDLLAIRASIAGSDEEARALTGALDAALATRDLEACIQRLYALAFHPRTLKARLDHGLPPCETRLAVVVQRFVAAEQSGLVWSLDTGAVGGDDLYARATPMGTRARVRACFGLAGGLGGRLGNPRIAVDELTVRRPALADEGLPDDAPVQLTPHPKSTALRRDVDKAQGTRMVALAPAEQGACSLSAVQARLVVKEALRLEAALGKPQAITFAYAGRLLHILDVEPLLLPRARVPSERTRLWDERLLPAALTRPTATSMSSASATGVSTAPSPLSFSVWQRGVARGLERTGRLFGVRGVVLEESRPLFRRCLGLISGRLTGSVDVVTALVDLLPFAEKARVALARATGQPELATRRDGDHLVAGLGGGTQRSGRSLWDRARQKIDDSRWPGQLERLAEVAAGESLAFVEQVEQSVAPLAETDLQRTDPDTLLDVFERLEESLARVVAAMGLTGLVAALWQQELRRLLDEHGLGAHFFDLLIQETPTTVGAACGDPLALALALEPVQQLLRSRPALRERLLALAGQRDLDDDALMRLLTPDTDHAGADEPPLPPQDAADLRRGLQQVVDACGGVVPEGRLLLEDDRLQERPARLLRLLVRAQRSPTSMTPRGPTNDAPRDLATRLRDGAGLRKHADYAVDQRLAALPALQQSAARKRLNTARDLAGANTDTFARLFLPLERVIFHLRRVALALGERLFEHQLLEHPADVFCLQDAELAALVRGTGPDSDVRPLVLARRRAAAARPPGAGRRVETHGVVATSLLSDDDEDGQTSPGRDEVLCGHPGASGRAQGRVWLVEPGQRGVPDDGVRHLRDRNGGAAGEITAPGQPVPSQAARSTDEQAIVDAVGVAPWPDLFALPLYAACEAMVFERGAVDSVVAQSLRRLAIPVVVEAPAATALLTDGVEVVVVADVAEQQGTVQRASMVPEKARPRHNAVPTELFVREAIASDPAADRPFDDDGRPFAPGARDSTRIPPPAGFFEAGSISPSQVVRHTMRHALPDGPPTGSVDAFSVPPVRGVLSEEGQPVDEEDVIEASIVDGAPAGPAGIGGIGGIAGVAGIEASGLGASGRAVPVTDGEDLGDTSAPPPFPTTKPTSEEQP